VSLHVSAEVWGHVWVVLVLYWTGLEGVVADGNLGFSRDLCPALVGVVVLHQSRRGYEIWSYRP